MMNVGLLWYDADRARQPRTKIEEAAERYWQKFGVWPNACHVNPEDKLNHPWLRVVENKAIRRYHYWLGVDEEFAAVAEPPEPPSGVTRLFPERSNQRQKATSPNNKTGKSGNGEKVGIPAAKNRQGDLPVTRGSVVRRKRS